MTDQNSQNALARASKTRAAFSGHKGALGAGGYVDPAGANAGGYDFLSQPGESQSLSPSKEGLGDIHIGAAWDNIKVPFGGALGRLIGLKKKANVDLDLGCLYELTNGTRGVVQALGGMHGAYDKSPFIHLSEDERTGDKEGDDEFICINGAHWDHIKRVLLYVYIYDGVIDWAQVKPQIQINVPDNKPMMIVPGIHHKDLSLCVIAGIENVRGGLKLTNYTEFYPGHAEMDRAFGFGLQWADGQKGA